MRLCIKIFHRVLKNRHISSIGCADKSLKSQHIFMFLRFWTFALLVWKDILFKRSGNFAQCQDANMYFLALSRLRQRGCKSKLKYLLNMSCFWPKLCALSVKGQFNPRKWKQLLKGKIFLPKKVFPKDNVVSIPFWPRYIHEIFSYLETLIGKLDSENAEFYLMGDFNCKFASSQPNNNTVLLSNLSNV